MPVSSTTTTSYHSYRPSRYRPHSRYGTSIHPTTNPSEISIDRRERERGNNEMKSEEWREERSPSAALRTLIDLVKQHHSTRKIETAIYCWSTRIALRPTLLELILYFSLPPAHFLLSLNQSIHCAKGSAPAAAPANKPGSMRWRSTSTISMTSISNQPTPLPPSRQEARVSSGKPITMRRSARAPRVANHSDC